MRRAFFLVFFSLQTAFVFSQNLDSLTATKKIDSIFLVIKTLAGKNEIDKAFEALAGAEKFTLEKFGRESAIYGDCAFYYARLFYSKDESAESVKWYLEAKAIYEKALVTENAQYAMTLNNLASVYHEAGDLEKAEPLHLEAKAIREKVLGKEHGDYTMSLANLASFYYDIGAYEKAEPLFLETKAIREKTKGKESPEYARSLHNLATLYDDMGSYEKSELLFLECKALREKIQGKEHRDYAACVGSLARLYDHMGAYEKAEPLFVEALALREKLVGKEHRDYALTLNNFGSLYWNMGKYEKAEPLFLAALAIREKLLGKEHPLYASCLFNIATTYAAARNDQKAEPRFQELSEVNQTLLAKAVRYLSEQELGDYLLKFAEDQATPLTFAQRSGSKKIAAICFDDALFYKGFLLQAAGQLKQLALANPDATEKFNLLKSYESRLSALYAKPLASRDSTAIADLNTKANDLEKDITRVVAGYGQATRQVKWQEVQAALKTGEAAIEFVHFNVHFPKKTDSTMYGALVLLPAAEQPIFIPLFEEKTLDSLLKSSGNRKADYVNSLYTFADRGAVAIEKPKKSLFETLWQPLEPHLVGVKTIYFSPSGLLHRLNLAAIPTGEDQTLADRFQFIQVKSTRQLVVLDQSKNAENQAVLFGGIDFDLPAEASDSTASDFSKGDLAARSRGTDFGFEKTDDALRAAYPIFSNEKAAATKKGLFKKRKKAAALANRGGIWGYLPGTEKEIAAIEKLLSASEISVQTHRGKGATEDVFKKIGLKKTSSPKVLHLATHGYFFPDSKKNEQSGDPVFKISEHPMLRSGLILAGGNAAWQGIKTFEGREDGILTAYEISQMNLSNTELVVLSACETGLGDIQGNEGVYGLQRAFKIAGAKYLIMSLWQVPDRQTTELMKAFYQNWLVEKREIPDAFRAAQQAMRERFVDPYAWAGFVLIE